MCAALICVLAPLSLPLTGPVPLSLATFAVMLSGVLLGGRLGALSTAVYLILGIVGLPVCAGYTPALPRLMGPTGGYLVGYLPLAFCCGAFYTALGRNRRGVKKYAALLLGMLAGTAALYAFGTAWFCILNRTDPLSALAVCVIPFLPGDAIKIAAVLLLTPPLEIAIAKIPSKNVADPTK